MEKCITEWFDIIENMSTDNTYKLAWGRAILECIKNEEYKEFSNDEIQVSFIDIAEKMTKYYWNQGFFFNLNQGNKNGKEVVIVRYANQLIDKYKEINGNLPVWFEEGKQYFIRCNNSFYFKTLNKISNHLHVDVSYRFLIVNKERKNIYKYDKYRYGSLIIFNKKDIEVVKEYAVILSRLLNFKWAQLLEKFNFAPKSANKVSNLSLNKIKRNTLTKFKEQLLKQFEDGKIIDFYSGEEISEDDITLDHVIPWSFMYSDNIWNLVITSKSKNSSKSNKVPSKEDIDKLKLRNKKLINLVSESFKQDLKEAEELNYVDKFYFDMRV